MFDTEMFELAKRNNCYFEFRYTIESAYNTIYTEYSTLNKHTDLSDGETNYFVWINGQDNYKNCSWAQAKDIFLKGLRK